MSRTVSRTTLVALVLTILAGAVGLRLGLAQSRDLSRITIESAPSTSSLPGVARLALTTIYRDGRVLFLMNDGYHEGAVTIAVAEDLFRTIEASARSWDDTYGVDGASSVLTVGLVGLERTIRTGDLYSSPVTPATLRSIIAATGRWTRELDLTAKVRTDLPIVAYLLPIPANTDMPEYPMPTALDATAAASAVGAKLDASTLAAIQEELPVVGTFTGDNVLHVVDSAGEHRLLAWNVDWDRIAP